MYWPDGLEPYRSLVAGYRQGGLVRQLLFSGPTYQIEIIDRLSGEPYWVFVQGSDCFCNCQTSSEQGACEHMAVAWECVHERAVPLHERFERSVWRQLEAPRWGALGPQGEALLAALAERPVESEESSIKFSGLPEEELDAWRRGRPSAKLQFELSPWADLAKQLFWQQEQGAPCQLQRDGARVVLELPGVMRVTGHIVGELPPMEEAVAALPVQYAVWIERRYLHVEAYLREPHDLASVEGDWGVLVNGERVRVEPLHFEAVRLTIPPDEVEAFIGQHRCWLGLHEGFIVHQLHDEDVAYTIASDGSLSFSVRRGTPHEPTATFGDWLYCKGHGFYPRGHNGQLPREPIPARQVEEWIRTHHELLAGVPGFFVTEAPIAGLALHVGLRRGSIVVEPQYERGMRLYGEWLYVEGKGFYRLPAAWLQLATPRVISRRDREQWDLFFTEQLPHLRATSSCTLDPRLEFAGVPRLEELDLKSLLAAQRRGDRFLPTKRGIVDLDADCYQVLPAIGRKRILDQADRLKLRAYFSAEEEPLKSEPPDCTALQASLRPYQQAGVEWLYGLYLNGLSGLLCDDMGVGKTHQAMGLISAVRAHNPVARFLVICPASLVCHWEEKLAAFLPSIQVEVCTSVHQRPSERAALVLTTYGIWRSAHARWKCSFDLAIFDELQIAKNHISQIHQALRQVQARMRLGLTGTPIENTLRELKSVFDLVLPGYLPDEVVFREFFMRPVEQGNKARQGLLSRLIKPLLLRRRKQDVLPDLPEKIEELHHVELLKDQAKLYHHVAAAQTSALLQQLRDETSPIPYMHIFALLSALKQICNHPATYLHDVERASHYQSGKWEAFTELLEEAQESQQKVVVFSQYLAMLDLMSAWLRQENIGYAELRGSTRGRGEEISRFQRDPSCKVFLGSLQAAGLGIDLTAASVVIHYDRWWNPARENQATDRVHRIGQERGVQVFKLMTKGTIEEQIDRMIERKKGLLEEVVGWDDQRLVKKLSRQELIALLEEVRS